MSLPPLASDAKIASDMSAMALQAMADAQFISQAAQAITNAEEQGIFSVTLTTFEHCSISNLQGYMQSLGYVISYPDFGNPNLSPYNPAQLFGIFYVDYWTNNRVINQPFINPARMRIDWRTPTALPSAPFLFQFVPEYEPLNWILSLLFP